MTAPQQALRSAVSSLRVPRLEIGAAFWGSALWVFAALVLIDALAVHIVQIGTIGVGLWYLSYLYLIVFAGIAVRDVVQSSLATRAPFVLIVVALYVAIVALNVTDPRSLGGESPHEIACSLSALSMDAGHGFRVTCLFGYPSRQFLLPDVPSLLLGRSQLALSLGGAFYFLLGVLIFAGGVIRSLRPTLTSNLFAALLLSVFPSVYFWNHFILIFEQSIFPLSFALILGGLFLYYLAGDARTLPLIGILLLYLIESYTPSLAVYALALVVLVYLVATHRASADRLPLVLGIVGGSLVVLVASLSYRQDININAGSNPSVRQDLWNGFEHIIYLNHGLPMTSPALVGPLLLLVALCLAWQFGREGFAIGVWVIGVFVLAVASHGYSLNSVDFRLHRSMIVFPVLITLLAVAARRWDLSRLRDPLLVALVVLLVTGLKFHLDYRDAQPPNHDLAFMSWLHTHVSSEGTTAHPRSIVWTPGADQNLPALRDVLMYFVPTLQGGPLDAVQTGPGCPFTQHISGIAIAQTTASCYPALARKAGKGELRSDGMYIQQSGQRLAVFER